MMQKKVINYIFMLFCSLFFVTIFSKCSFLYPINDWVDSNCFFTVGKAMANGQVLYRDIYEQKGIYLYFIHVIAYLISNDSFIGIYILEVLLGSFYLYSVSKLLGLYINYNDKKKYFYIPFIALITYSVKSFCQGDSVEEFVLYFLPFFFYSLIKYIRNDNISILNLILAGMFAGVIFLMKFTLLGFFFSFILIIFIHEIIKKRTGKAFLYVLYFACGIILSFIPALIYFIATSSFSDFFTCYIYNNLFLYNNVSDVNLIKKIGLIIFEYLKSMIISYSFYILIIPGFIYLILSKDILKSEKKAILITYGIMNLFIYAGARGYDYYSYPVGVFAAYGIVAIDYLYEKYAYKLKYKYLDYSIVLSVFFIALLFISENPRSMFVKKKDHYLYQMAEIVNKEESPSLLNYGSLDVGLYTAANINPSCKYFCGLNIPLEDIKIVQDYYTENKLVSFVVTKDIELQNDNYELVYYHKESHMFYEEEFYLYKIKEN